jgi:hypothetical protein
MFSFSNKVVYIISPEYWSDMKVSKQHYAIELAKSNSKVFYIEPPNLINTSTNIRPAEDNQNINIVSYRPVFRGKRWLPGFIFNLLLKKQVRLLKKKIGASPDIIWNFSSHLFNDLKLFGAKVNIMFVADIATEFPVSEETKTADLVLTVSQPIADHLASGSRNVRVINHGLQDKFVKVATEKLHGLNPLFANKVEKAGYSGNLLIDGIDHQRMLEVITKNSGIQFHFWGRHEEDEKRSASSIARAFVENLRSQANVILHGIVDADQLYNEMKAMDVLWLCMDNKVRDCSNSHKLLEYFSFGKPVVSNYVSTYDKTGIMYMLPGVDNSDYLSLFNSSVKQISAGEPIELIRKRLEFAIDNSYRSNISRIEDMVTQHVSFYSS